MYRHLQVSQQHFNWVKVQTLAGAIQSTNPLSLKPFLCSFAGIIWVIVLLHNPLLYQLQLPDLWQEILVKNLLTGLRTHGSLDNIVQVQKQKGSPRPSHFHYLVSLLRGGSFLDMQCWLFSKLGGFYLGLICPENGLPEDPCLSKCSLAKLKEAALYFFQSRGFLLATLP